MKKLFALMLALLLCLNATGVMAEEEENGSSGGFFGALRGFVDKASQALDGAGEWVDGAIDSASEWMDGAIDWAEEWSGKAWDGTVQWVSGVWDDTRAYVNEGLYALAGWYEGAKLFLSEKLEGASEEVKEAWELIEEAASGAKEFSKEELQKALETIRQWASEHTSEQDSLKESAQSVLEAVEKLLAVLAREATN